MCRRWYTFCGCEVVDVKVILIERLSRVGAVLQLCREIVGVFLFQIGVEWVFRSGAEVWVIGLRCIFGLWVKKGEVLIYHRLVNKGAEGAVVCRRCARFVTCRFCDIRIAVDAFYWSRKCGKCLEGALKADQALVGDDTFCPVLEAKIVLRS